MLTKMEADIISDNKENTSATNLINLGESGILKRNSYMNNNCSAYVAEICTITKVPLH